MRLTRERKWFHHKDMFYLTYSIDSKLDLNKTRIFKSSTVVSCMDTMTWLVSHQR